MASPRIDVKPNLHSPPPSQPKTTPPSSGSATPSVNNHHKRLGCVHQPSRLWNDENDQVIKNLLGILKALEAAPPASSNQPLLAAFCLRCRTATSPRLVCLGCAAVLCFDNLDRPALKPCYLSGHSTKSSKCLLGLDLSCRELICMVCGTIVQPDDHELKILSRRLFPQVKRAYAPGCVGRTTSTIMAPRGFRNLGNSCYMNVILQILLRIPELQGYLLTDHHNRLKHRSADEVWCCACELIDILQLHHLQLSQLQQNRSKALAPAEPISPVGFLYALWLNSGDGEEFAGYRESDAHECLLACLNQLHTATQVPTPQAGAHAVGPASGSTTTPTTIAAAATTTIASGPPSSAGEPTTRCQCPIDLLFRCELTSQVVCGSCRKTSYKVDPILDLSLEIGHLNHLETLRLEDCLHSFTKAERLKEKCYTCHQCSVASPETTKSLTISRLPHILCIQLKRFEHHLSSASKLDRFVKFPLVLDMKPFASPNLAENRPDLLSSDVDGYYYKLTGIVRHQGNVSSGHYQAIIYQDEQYFCFNDESVSILRLEEVLKVEAYILVYTFILP
ncbi:hypothetical protein PGT21_025557 [Puccinia graminis f. sp. tritici]|uniref:Ubiquitin carboxyl-terminal hydrolase n=2 Tax=Puccinia graminis f. sp. tritici TaxID=56615 RepID=H6QSR5_PUCGT|nr:uncharacterized protein PGTG_21821 [Puccinia graminis f. sp. tritici CRL 75-36-700-3]EHS63805.1 hypothetical protein PGTG_21821 [Puccinia graminis f. sp. tritici CRL 75-36-700-3]KAA1073785.1 hypothetical protein PGT21_025557 [Puccinia graminis f. sp. tritici]